MKRLLLRIGEYVAITALFRSASVLKNASLVTNDFGSSVRRSRQAATATETDNASGAIQSLAFMAVSFAQNVRSTPTFHTRARGYAPSSMPRCRASPPMLLTSGSNPEYFVAIHKF